MSKLSQYPLDTSPVSTDYLLGDQAVGPTTSRFKLSDLLSFFFNNIPNASVPPSSLATGAKQAFVTTSETTASTSYADLATTTDTVTVTVGANGLALVSIYAHLQLGTASGESAWVGFAISGATTQAASDTLALRYQPWTAGAFGKYGATFLATGLTAGSNTFKLKYRVTSNTGTFLDRRISVVPL